MPMLAAIKADPTSPYYANGTDEGIKDAVYNLLLPSTNQFDNKWHNFEPEMSDNNFWAFQVWHRGLAIPRARNLQDPEVQRGKEVFMEIGCANCHRPSWKTTTDNYWNPLIIASQNLQLPRYQNQTIWPYTDMIQHRLYMKNGIHGSWCRTTPLWGRGLSLINTGAEDRLHDCRARNEIGCAACHRPSWKTTKDDYWSPKIITSQNLQLPRYQNQTIWPYTDMIQHRLYMKNGIHGSWCRTTPLWGRGLSLINTGAEDRLHDCRARNEIEAILWHGYSKKSDGYAATLKFYKLPKADRDAVVKFLRAI